ncbi:MAG: hypothetical protein ABI670_00740 [Chloroflexota bacterium]
MEYVSDSLMIASEPDYGSAGDPMVRTILGALAYADLFDYPLSAKEITRYQIESSFSAGEIGYCLATSPALADLVRHDGNMYCLRGRENVLETRRARSKDSQHVWSRARLYARLLADMPFVRLVAITGALAVDNIAARPDIDWLIVAKQGRVWLCRRLIIGLVRVARLFGDDLCPNYIISETRLSLDQQDLFTAHELAQMVPLYGKELYKRMIAQNAWAFDYLPAAFSDPYATVPTRRRGPFRRVAECLLSARMFDRWERWELKRLRQKLRPLVGEAAEVICSPDQCKGHTGLHRQWVTTRYSTRLRELGL